jgi:hypothetical protein
VIAAIVETKTLGKVVLYSLISGIGIAVIFGAGVSSAAGLLEAMRQRRPQASAAWGLLAVICMVGALAAVVSGILVMTAKG